MVIEWVPLGIGVLIAVALFQLLAWAKRSLMLFISEKQRRKINLNRLQSQLANLTTPKLDTGKTSLGWPGWRKLKIKRIDDESADIRSFYLYPHDEKDLPEFRPGQYLTLSLKHESRVGRLIRCYSLSHSFNKHYYRISVKRIHAPEEDPTKLPGLGSNFMHDQLILGDVIDVKAPRGNFYMNKELDMPMVLIAGGIGIAPILSMLNSLIDNNSKREAWFFYGIRSPEDQIQAAHFQQISKQYPNIHVHICYSNYQPEGNDQAPSEEYQDITIYNQRINIDLFKQILPKARYEYCLCGPTEMLNELTTGLKEWGVDEHNIHIEAFSRGAVKSKITRTKNTEEQADEASSKFFEINFTQSQKTVLWNRDSGSILELAKDNDIYIDHGCGAGSCGTCAIPLISGELGYLVSPNYEIDEKICYSCLAEPRSNLVLDA